MIRLFKRSVTRLDEARANGGGFLKFEKPPPTGWAPEPKRPRRPVLRMHAPLSELSAKLLVLYAWGLCPISERGTMHWRWI